MERFNVFNGELPTEQDRPGHAWRGRSGVARELGLRNLGASKVGVRPGGGPDRLNFRRDDAVDYWDGE